MYIPKQYQVKDRAALIAVIKANSFGILISNQDNRPVATHLPFVLDEKSGEQGMLFSHIARANPQGQQLTQGQEVLAIFQGPHAYVSPTWYESEFNVPTWNYAVVHVYGQVRIIDDLQKKERMLDDLVAQHEGSDPGAWSVPWADTRYVKLTGGIIAFEIEISRMEGSFKLSQNKSDADQQGAILHLQQSTDEQQQAVAAMMCQHRNREEESPHV